MADAPFPHDGDVAAARPSSGPAGLTSQHREVLTRFALGQQQRRIAQEMGVTDHTVKALTRTVYEQLGAVNNAHAVALAIGLELIPATVATHPTQGAPDVP